MVLLQDPNSPGSSVPASESEMEIDLVGEPAEDPSYPYNRISYPSIIRLNPTLL